MLLAPYAVIAATFGDCEQWYTRRDPRIVHTGTYMECSRVARQLRDSIKRGHIANDRDYYVRPTGAPEE